MNQATSRRLRPRTLLLLVPLLMASTPPVLPLAGGLALAAAGQPDHLAWVNLPPEFLVGHCAPLGVELRDSTEAPVKALAPIRVQLSSTLLGGTFYDSDACAAAPINAVDIPTDSTGRQVWYRAPTLGVMTLSASDGLLGLRDALSLAISIVNSLTTELKLTGVPPVVEAGVPITATVTARNQLGVATMYSGTVLFTTTAPHATLPQSYTFNPDVDSGTRTFSVTFQSAGKWELTVQDTNAQLQDKVASIEVLPGAATHFAVELPAVVKAGSAVSFNVIPLDAAENPTTRSAQLRFSTDVAEAQLPPNNTSNTTQLPTQFTATFYSASPSAKTLTVSDVSTLPNITGSANVVVQNGPFEQVVLSSSPPNPVPACGEVTVKLTAVDAWNNPFLDEPIPVELCKAQDRTASFVSTTLGTYTALGDCVSGVLQGSAEVLWKDSEAEDVEFKLSAGKSRDPLVVSWKAGLPSFANSTLRFLESSEIPPPLRTYTGQLTLQLALRDLCGNPAILPSGKTLSFAAEPPLFVANPPEKDDQDPSLWTVSARLPECPQDPLKPLALWPLFNGEPLFKPSGERVERRVLPQCLPPFVQLKLLSPAEHLVVEPGALAEFEVEVSNSNDQPITDGVLMVPGEGLTVLAASIGDKILTAKAEGFGLPELRKDAPLTVKVQVQATTQPDQKVRATVWCAHSDGSPLTEKTPVSFTQERLGVDVGCGCHAAALPSQLFPWLALLLAASRPWKRLRRLRRGERIDHQAPWR